MNYQENYKQLREIKIEFSHSGLPGFIKVWNYTIVYFFLTSSLLLFLILVKLDKKSVIILSILALFSSILKTFFTMDRITILGILIVVFVAFYF